MSKLCEELPVNNFYKVLRYHTISKSSKWWSVIALVQSMNRIKICLYLWQKKDNEWKRKHKFIIANRAEYEEITSVMKEYINLL